MNLRRRYADQANLGIGLIIAILFAAALAVGGTAAVVGKKLNTVQTVDAGLTVYDGLVIGADTYVTECAEHVIDQSCVPIAQKVYAAAESTKAAYLKVKPYGTNPPQDVGAAFIAAINVLQAYFVTG